VGSLGEFRNLSPEERERMLNRALSEFAENGYTQASLKAIAHNLGITQGGLFRYFSDKPGLYTQVFEYVLDRLTRMMNQVKAETKGRNVFERLRRSLHSSLDLFDEDPRYLLFYLHLVYEKNVSTRGRLIWTVRLVTRDYLMELLREGREAGDLRSDADLGSAAFILDAAMERFMVAYTVQYMDLGFGVFASPLDKARAKADALVETLRRGLGATE